MIARRVAYGERRPQSRLTAFRPRGLIIQPTPWELFREAEKSLWGGSDRGGTAVNGISLVESRGPVR
jgi:hypothetical protein